MATNLYIISIDAYGTSKSKNFNKCITASDMNDACEKGEKWMDSLIRESDGEFPEWELVEVSVCHDKKKKEGDVWCYVIDEETYTFSEE